MGSGFQKFILDIIMRIVLTNISTISNSNLIFIDEGFGCLDKENFLHIADILKKLKHNFSAMVIITHIPELKSYADKSITIKKLGADSLVKHGDIVKEKYSSSEEKQTNLPNQASLIIIRGKMYYCKSCDTERKYTEQAVARHLSSKSYVAKHNRYLNLDANDS
jgi:ABC-type multidrug transport system ATPase subunit